MARATTGTARRLLRAALASGVLAVCWLVVDLVAHTEPAAAAQTAAAQTIDAPDLVDVASGTLDAATLPATPVIDTVVNPVVRAVAPVTAPIVVAVVTPVQPYLVAAGIPVADGVVRLLTPFAPLIEPVVPVISQILAPVAENVLVPLVPSIVAVAPPLVEIVRTVSAQLGVLPTSGLLLVSGGLLLGVALAPLAPSPLNGEPRNAPTPALPSGSSGNSALYAEVIVGAPSVLETRVSTGTTAFGLPASPTFAFDTTPG